MSFAFINDETILLNSLVLMKLTNSLEIDKIHDSVEFLNSSNTLFFT